MACMWANLTSCLLKSRGRCLLTVQTAMDLRLTWQLNKCDLKMRLPVMAENWS